VKKPPKRTSKPAAAGRGRSATAVALDDERITLREELAEARAELARIASGENSARRDLEARVSAASSLEERLRAEQEALRVDLRTALADLEIARADLNRAVERAQAALRETADARESERLATHASDAAREQLATVRAQLERTRIENETLRKHLFAANEELKRAKESRA
jgi:chromosome segregation ATPase